MRKKERRGGSGKVRGKNKMTDRKEARSKKRSERKKGAKEGGRYLKSWYNFRPILFPPAESINLYEWVQGTGVFHVKYHYISVLRYFSACFLLQLIYILCYP